MLCVFESPPPPLSLSLPSPLVLLGVTCRRGPAVEKHRFRFPFTLPPNGNGSLKQGGLERVESQRMITGCAVTRGNSEDPVRREQGT